jgi:hypothetical protein
MTDTDDWPSLAQELGRKTTEQIERFSRAYDAARIDKKTFFLVLTALNDATSGIIPKDVSDLIAEIDKDLRTT